VFFLLFPILDKSILDRFIPFQDEFTSKFTLFMRRLRGILSEEERAGTEIQI
jgi:hypothetical protein